MVERHLHPSHFLVHVVLKLGHGVSMRSILLKFSPAQTGAPPPKCHCMVHAFFRSPALYQYFETHALHFFTFPCLLFSIFFPPGSQVFAPTSSVTLSCFTTLKHPLLIYPTLWSISMEDHPPSGPLLIFLNSWTSPQEISK